MPNQEAATKRIEEALQNNSTRLDLSQLGLNALPPAFAQIAPKLTVLNLWDNKFQSVPREMSLCTNLESLYFSQNELMTGFGLATFRKLTLLDLQSNRFSDFPPEVLELPLLRNLFLAKNKIARLPAGIRLLKELETLDLSDCQIETLPSEIAELPLLKEIKLHNNPLKSPPLEIAAQGIRAIRAYFDDLTKNTQRAESKKYLLPIAIENYPPEFNYGSRPGCIQECRDLTEVLHKKYGYEPVITRYSQGAEQQKDFYSLFNAIATRSAIFDALDDLNDIAAAEDCVIVYFSGWTGDGLPEGDLRSYDNAYIPLPEILARFSSMKARHALLIVDNHLQSRQFSQTRGIESERSTFASRWALYRVGADWDARFTPHLTNWLKNNTLGEVSVRETASILHGALASSLSIAGDEGGEFLIEPRAESNVGGAMGLPDVQEQEAGAGPPESGDFKEMIFQIFVDGLREKIAEGKTADAISELQFYINTQSKFKDEVTTHVIRVNTPIKGPISDMESVERSNKIRYDIINFLDKLSSTDIDLSKFSLQPNTKTRSDAEKELLDEITREIIQIENLRKEYLSETSLEKKREKEVNLQKAVQGLEGMQSEFSKKFRADKSAHQQTMESFFAEENRWKKAVEDNTISAFENYLKETKSGDYNNEAQRRISDLRLLEQEEALFENIKKSPNLSSIQSYQTTFPNGVHRAEVEKILADLEAAEAELWKAAETNPSIAASITAYKEYQSKTVLGKYREAARTRIEQLEKEGTVGRVNEAKLIFVGNGRVGKTSLSKVLAGDKFDPGENSTHGVRIKSWPVKLPDGRSLKINVWDFGGQEVYHNTHRFFLTTRALYMLVWDKEAQEDALLHPDRDDHDR
ncbi:MAG: caspase family protein, partial [Saprospiraceae bacterium]|nr:caspase family protein [Saprospiraceae bacterium]